MMTVPSRDLQAPASPPVSVALLVKDDYLRSVLATAMALESDLRVVVRGHDLESSLPSLRSALPDVVIWDADVEGAGMAHDLVRLRQACRDAGLLALTGGLSASGIQHLFRLGVRGFVDRNAPTGRLVRAVRQLATALAAARTLRNPGLLGL